MYGEKIIRKSIATVNCLVTNILPNNFSRKKETHADLDGHKFEQLTDFSYLFLLMNVAHTYVFTNNIYRESVGSNGF